MKSAQSLPSKASIKHVPVGQEDLIVKILDGCGDHVPVENAGPILKEIDSCGDQNSGAKSSCGLRLGALLVFHVLNALLAIGSVIFCAMLLISLALTPVLVVALWVDDMGSRVYRWFWSIDATHRVGCLQKVVLIYPLLVLQVIGGVIVFIGGISGMFVIFTKLLVPWLIRGDAYVANFALVFTQRHEPTRDSLLNPNACYDVFDAPFDRPRTDEMQRCYGGAWYLIVVKVVVGALSACAVSAAVVQPVLIICTGGNDPFVDWWITFQLHPYAYVGVIFALWVVGVAGLVFVTILSVALTYFVCDWAADHAAAHNEPDESEAATVATTPSEEPSISSFTENQSPTSRV